MAEWKCTCGKQNHLRIRKCSCGQTIPKTEIRRIANLELEIQIQEAHRIRSIKRTTFFHKSNAFLRHWPQRVLTVLTVIIFLVIIRLDNQEVSFYTERAIGLIDEAADTVYNIMKVDTSATEKLLLLIRKGYGAVDENLSQAGNNVEDIKSNKLSLLAEKIDIAFKRLHIY